MNRLIKLFVPKAEFSWLVWILLPASITVAAQSDFARAAEIDFGRDIQPILNKNCTACHNDKKHEAGLNLANFQALMLGGDSGSAIDEDDWASSLLLERIISKDDPMPPEDNDVGAENLQTDELELLRSWLQRGAPAPSASTSSVQLQPLPPGIRTIYGMAASPDGQYLAIGNGNRLLVASELRTEKPSTHFLVDEQLASSTQSPSIAHLDAVQSLVFSPDSQTIASGGFRTVKLWRRNTVADTILTNLPQHPQLTEFSPDGSWLAIVNDNLALELVHLEQATSHRFLRAHQFPVLSLEWLDDSRRLISCDSSGAVVLTDASNWQQTQLRHSGETETAAPLVHVHAASNGQLYGVDQKGTLSKIEFDPWRLTPVCQIGPLLALTSCEGRQNEITAAQADGTVSAIDLTTGLVESLFKLEHSATSLHLRADGALLAATSAAGPATLWNVAERKLVAQLNVDYDLARQLAKRESDVARQSASIELLSGQLPGLEEASKKEVELQAKLQESRDKSNEALQQIDTKVMASETAVSETMSALIMAQAAIEEAKKHAESVAADLEEKRKQLAEIQQKRQDAQSELANRDQALAAAADSANRAAAAIPALKESIAAEQQRLQVLSQLRDQVQEETQDLEPVQLLRFVPDAQELVIVRPQRPPQLISTVNGSPIASLYISASSLSNPAKQETQANSLPLAHDSAIEFTAIDCAPDGQLLGLSDKGLLFRWNVQLPWVHQATLGGADQDIFSDRITSLDFSPDGRFLAVGSGPPSRFGDLKIVDVVSSEVVRDYGQLHSDTILGVRYSPDGRKLATVGADKICRIVSVESGETLRALEGHTHHLLGVTWQDNGHKLATAGADQVIKIWDADSGQQDRTISGFGKEVAALQFIGTSNQLVSASVDGKVRLHDTTNGKQVREYTATSKALFAVAVSPDGNQLIAGGLEGVAHCWQSPDGKLLWNLSKEPRSLAE
ncbi:MAG: hypothetical protein KDB22_21560 [Planctomycetales bacterium]|nr:hypothetical protein [Planctomycetales bacterium]